MPAETGESAPPPVTVNQIILAYIPFAEKHYLDRDRTKG